MKKYVLVYDYLIIMLYIVALVFTMIGYPMISSKSDIIVTLLDIIILGAVNVVFIEGDR